MWNGAIARRTGRGTGRLAGTGGDDGLDCDTHLLATLGHELAVRGLGARRGRGHGHATDETRGGNPEHGVESAETHGCGVDGGRAVRRTCEALDSHKRGVRSGYCKRANNFLRVCQSAIFFTRARVVDCRAPRLAPASSLRAVGGTRAAQAAPRRDAMSLREGERALQRFHEWCAKEGVEYDREVRPESSSSPSARRLPRRPSAVAPVPDSPLAPSP